jgi:hypothetical protein
MQYSMFFHVIFIRVDYTEKEMLMNDHFFHNMRMLYLSFMYDWISTLHNIYSFLWYFFSANSWPIVEVLRQQAESEVWFFFFFVKVSVNIYEQKS